MNNAYMNEWDIQTLAEEALKTFEMTASWNRSFEAAIEFAADEWEIKATKAQAATAIAIAKTGWEGIKQSVKKVHYRVQD
tara:strand:+ start:406 stop:645 length:240 start_codon:yes stop_codon:yes gene_type:complete